MGIYSTLSITRQDAEDKIRLAAANLDKYHDREIESILFALYQNRNYWNYSIVPDYTTINWHFNYHEYEDDFKFPDIIEDDETKPHPLQASTLTGKTPNFRQLYT